MSFAHYITCIIFIKTMTEKDSKPKPNIISVCIPRDEPMNDEIFDRPLMH